MFQRMARRAVAAAVCLAALSAEAAEAKGEPRRVAVKAFAAKGVESSAASVLESDFCSKFPADRFSVLCPSDLQALMQAKQQDMSLGTCGDEDACAQQVAKLAEATLVVIGEVSRLGELYVVSVALMDTSANKVLGRAKETASKLEALLDKMEPLVNKLIAAK